MTFIWLAVFVNAFTYPKIQLIISQKSRVMNWMNVVKALLDRYFCQKLIKLCHLHFHLLNAIYSKLNSLSIC